MRAQIWIPNQRSSKNFNNFRHLQANPLDISGRNEYIVGGKQKNQCFPPGSCQVRRFYPGSPGRRWPPPAAPFSRSLWVPQQLRFASPAPVGQTHGHPPRHQESWQSGDSGPSPPGMPPCQTSCSVLCTAWSKARPDKLLMLATEGLTEKPPPWR